MAEQYSVSVLQGDVIDVTVETNQLMSVQAVGIQGLSASSGLPGILTANTAVVVDGNKKINEWYVDNLYLNDNTISTTNTNGNLLLTPNGTGKTVITNLYIGDDTTSLQEYINDSAGLTIAAGTGLTSTVSDPGNTTTLSITNTAVTAGSYGSATAIPTFTVNQQGQLTAAGTVSITTALTIAGDSGTDSVSLATDTLTFSGGEGIDIAVTNNTVTIAAEDATSANKGVASFNSSYFTVSSGAVTLNDANSTSGSYGSSTKIPSFTVNAKGLITASSEADIDATIARRADTTYVGTTGIALNRSSAAQGLTGITSITSNDDLTLIPAAGKVINASSFRITSVADPVSDQDAATKIYVDTIATGLDPKQSVRLASTTNLTPTSYSSNVLASTVNGTLSLDGLTPSAGQRVLIKDQTAALQNGIYTVTSAGSPSSTWSLLRATDFDNAPGVEVTGGAFTFVEEGNTQADNGYVVTTNGTITVGVSAINFAQFSGAGQITAGAGLTKTGNVLDVGGTTDRILVNADSIDISPNYVGQSSITTLGTITTGTWQGNTISALHGGTGQAWYSVGAILVANAVDELTQLPIGTNGKILQSNGTTLVYDDIDGGTY